MPPKKTDSTNKEPKLQQANDDEVKDRVGGTDEGQKQLKNSQATTGADRKNDDTPKATVQKPYEAEIEDEEDEEDEEEEEYDDDYYEEEDEPDKEEEYSEGYLRQYERQSDWKWMKKKENWW